MAELIDGKQLAKQVNAQTKQAVAELKSNGILPKLVVIIVGNDEASEIYVRNKHRKAEQVGIISETKRLPENTTQTELLNLIDQYNQDPTVHGLMVQAPLPPQIDEAAVTRAILPIKDADGFNPENVGNLYSNSDLNFPVSCTPKGIMTMLKAYGVQLEGANAVIVGRSNIVGRPMAALLLNASATVTVVHSHTKDMKRFTRQADILIVATGIAHLIKGEDIKPGATVIDVGMNRDENGKLTGDVDFESATTVAGKITPVPGGVGPMTIASLMQQTVELAKWSE
ncbi:bifunctional methylenetetrahydrofolate dehydrogenase/methenyltetrahydrofolate cyclohydrolase [Lactobacillus sp. LC28-10]|uniref:Bifunctional protein FolD n=1 Tax=Secundilactobacillus angelensis TaxID=2722706 RepID=A0ABX1L150_9LACO|nr:tetrahydrofolate dehydrogenase/cyclohydrolase catalytic domain-containing protein [Secundilactobacillus angelensis]MCH5463294.1 bifunctional methylenetetrahydrofolate dehydrogenase/methenyltetrahydrofolate cyclohydrolase [Secundilactobacillus angelensis]NLR19222.1 bifunctional methylenetetrahydrofolate dehydrogenase/methenyltetrahydrofolate cyclohydrolase [Secundilactobacillus angelensis]